MTIKIKKAIIPAAGLGTRFLPATKAMPKEMLPIVDKPAIQYIVEEAIASGIEDIIIVTGKGKRAIEDHFDYVPELEQNLFEKQQFEKLEQIRKISEMVDIHYIRQKEPKGLGHAIWTARNFVGNEPFAVLLGDDIIHSKIPVLKQMIDLYEVHESSIVALKSVDTEDISRYGIINGIKISDHLYSIKNLIEKPSIKEAPSNLAVIGRYILTPHIFEILETQNPGFGGEIQLTDALSRLLIDEMVLGYEFEGKHFDVGDKFNYIKTIIEFALENEEIKDKLKRYLENLSIMNIN